MLHPQLVEESSLVQLAPNLRRVALSLGNNANHHDYLVAVFIVVMSETGFFIPPEEGQEGWTLKSVRIPVNWKSGGLYKLSFKNNIFRWVGCKLIGVPTGDTIILNICNGTPHCIAFQTLRYINPHSNDISGKFWNLRDFAFRLKDELVTPMRVELMTKIGQPSPSLQGVPFEVKVHIYRLLDPRSRQFLARAIPSYSNLNVESRGHRNRLHILVW